MTHFPKIQKVLADWLGASPQEIAPQTRLVEDLKIDSLDIIDIIMDLEEEFEIEISEADSEKCRTVADIHALIEKLCIAKNES
jgi:acyl carrier protein